MSAQNVGILSLGDLAITTSGEQIGTEIKNLDGLTAIGVQLRLAYGSGGTSVRAYLQTSIDQGTTWIDIACVLFGVASEVALLNLSGLTPRTAQLNPTDGALTDDTAVDGVLGDRLRLKAVSTGTYGNSTLLSGRIAAR